MTAAKFVKPRHFYIYWAMFSLGVLLLTAAISKVGDPFLSLRSLLDPLQFLSIASCLLVGALLVYEPLGSLQVLFSTGLFVAFAAYHWVIGNRHCDCLTPVNLGESERAVAITVVVFGLVASLVAAVELIGKRVSSNRLRHSLLKPENARPDVFFGRTLRLLFGTILFSLTGTLVIMLLSLISNQHLPVTGKIVSGELLDSRKIKGNMMVYNNTKVPLQICGFERSCSFSIQTPLPLEIPPHGSVGIDVVCGGKLAAASSYGSGKVFIRQDEMLSKQDLAWAAGLLFID